MTITSTVSPTSAAVREFEGLGPTASIARLTAMLEAAHQRVNNALGIAQAASELEPETREALLAELGCARADQFAWSWPAPVTSPVTCSSECAEMLGGHCRGDDCPYRPNAPRRRCDCEYKGAIGERHAAWCGSRS